MREIKFRAKSRYDNGWLYGIPVQDKDGNWFILEHPCDGYIETSILGEIDPETIGRYIGVKDKKGREVYEGDIVNVLFDGFDEYIKGVVFWDEKRFCWNIKDSVGDDYYDYFTGKTPFEAIEKIKIIGNVYENSELLKQGK